MKDKNTKACTVDAIHENCLVADAHFDLTMDICDRRDRGQTRVFETVYAQGFRNGGVNAVISSLFVHDHFLPEMALRKALDQISALHAEMDESGEKLALCRTTREIRAAVEKNRLAVLLSFEGVEPIGRDLALLRVFYELGVRGVGLVWSRRNHAADGSLFSPGREGQKGGLSRFGVKLVEEALKLGMYIDVSHLNDEGFQDVMEIVDGPVMASHSNCRSLVPVMRNLTDDQIRVIAGKGGVIGMNALDAFVGRPRDGHRLSAEDLVNHVDHIVSIAGVAHVAMGFDFDESFADYMNMGKAIKTYDVISGHGHIKQFTAALWKRGYSEAEIRLILGGNLLRFLSETIG